MPIEPVTVFLLPDWDQVVLPTATGTFPDAHAMAELIRRHMAVSDDLRIECTVRVGVDGEARVEYRGSAYTPGFVITQERVPEHTLSPRFQWLITRHWESTVYWTQPLKRFEQLLLAMAYVHHCISPNHAKGMAPAHLNQRLHEMASALRVLANSVVVREVAELEGRSDTDETERPIHPPLTELEREVSKRHVDEAIGVPPYGAELRRREAARLDEIMAAVQENQERQQQARDSAQQGLPPTAEVRRAVQQLAERWLAPAENLEAFVRALPHDGVVMMAVMMRNRCVELTRRVVELSRDVADLQEQLGAGGAG